MTSLLPDNLLDELNDLTFACLSGEASPEAIEHLNKLLLNSEPARRVYAHTIRDSFILRQWAAATELHTREMLGDDDSDAAFLRSAMADADLIATASSSNSREDNPHIAAPVAAVPVPGFFSTAYHGAIGFFSQELPFSLLIATVLTSLGLWAASMVYVSGPEKIAKDSPALPSKATVDPTLKVVGKITGMVDCKWADPQTETFYGANVLFGRKYALASGLMEITYHTGAKVILQGPVTYEVESNGGYLSVGKLTGKLEKKMAGGQWSVASETNPKSPIPNPFAIHTPTATVTDLGTEFGVEVGQDGTTDTLVFHGTVKLQPFAVGSTGDDDAILLRENESARAEKQSTGKNPQVTVRLVVPKRRAFVRQIVRQPRLVDLLDIVASGDGSWHRRERGIDPVSGTELPAFSVVGRSDGKYHRTTYYRYVDGIFVLDGSSSPVQIDSAGHVFGGFPKNSGQSFGCIFARAASVEPRDRQLGIDNSDYWVYGIRPDVEKEVMPGRRGLLAVHSNAGITFDVEAIRRHHGDWRSARFRAIGGKEATTLAEIWVFVDGRLRLRSMLKPTTQGWSGAVPIDIVLEPADRYLTLVSTDGGDGIDHDWVVFGDPVLQLGSEEAKEDPNL